MSWWNKAHDILWFGKFVLGDTLNISGGIVLMPYQFAFGFSVRPFGLAGLRFYFGPLKIHFSWYRMRKRPRKKEVV
jgi:hypothetical protein